MPELDPYSRQVLEFFLSPRIQNLWTRNDFDGSRQFIPTTELEAEARARGIVLSEFFLDKFAQCEAVLHDYDVAVRAALRPPPNPPPQT